MSTQAHTPTFAHGMSMLALASRAANPGLRQMRTTLAASEIAAALGLAPRTPPAKPTAKPTARVSARKPATQADTPDVPEGEMREWRVCVLVEASGATTHVWVSVTAGGQQRAGKAARAAALKAGHAPVGVCAVLRDDAPSAVLAAAR